MSDDPTASAGATPRRYKVWYPNRRKTFNEWITTRGGVIVWRNLDIGRPGAGELFTPLNDAAGNRTAKPHWAYGEAEVITSLTRFQFATDCKVVAKVKISYRRSDNGMQLVLTDAAQKRLRAACAKHPGSSYKFEGKVAIIEVCEWEE